LLAHGSVLITGGILIWMLRHLRIRVAPDSSRRSVAWRLSVVGTAGVGRVLARIRLRRTLLVGIVGPLRTRVTGRRAPREEVVLHARRYAARLLRTSRSLRDVWIPRASRSRITWLRRSRISGDAAGVVCPIPLFGRLIAGWISHRGGGGAAGPTRIRNCNVLFHLLYAGHRRRNALRFFLVILVGDCPGQDHPAVFDSDLDILQIRIG
jgi:hypothetical protein